MGILGENKQEEEVYSGVHPSLGGHQELRPYVI
jgi:hypothetical protein